MEAPTTKTASKKGQKPVHTIRRGAIAANIWLRQTQTGLDYYDYSLSRSWKSKNTGKSGYSTSFFASNGPEIIEVAQAATDWIVDKESNNAPEMRDMGIPVARIQPVKVPASEARN